MNKTNHGIIRSIEITILIKTYNRISIKLHISFSFNFASTVKKWLELIFHLIIKIS